MVGSLPNVWFEGCKKQSLYALLTTMIDHCKGDTSHEIAYWMCGWTEGFLLCSPLQEVKQCSCLPVHVCLCVCVCMLVHTHACVRTCACTCVHACACVCASVSLSVSVYVCVCLQGHMKPAMCLAVASTQKFFTGGLDGICILGLNMLLLCACCSFISLSLTPVSSVLKCNFVSVTFICLVHFLNLSVPEIHLHVAGMLSNQQTNNPKFVFIWYVQTCQPFCISRNLFRLSHDSSAFPH